MLEDGEELAEKDVVIGLELVVGKLPEDGEEFSEVVEVEVDVSVLLVELAVVDVLLLCVVLELGQSFQPSVGQAVGTPEDGSHGQIYL
ncbi:hypothetical protein LTR66_017992, partial [Elasticomyces elasticus]